MREQFFLGGVLGLCIGAIISAVIYAGSDTYQMVQDKKHTIDACEVPLPRNQFCDAKWVAFVKPKPPASYVDNTGEHEASPRKDK